MKRLEQREIDRMANELAEIATSPALLSALQGMRHSSIKEEALAEARRIASLDFLKSQGVQPPDDFRITTRSFEPPEQAPIAKARVSDPIVALEYGKLTVACDGWVVCVEQV